MAPKGPFAAAVVVRRRRRRRRRRSRQRVVKRLLVRRQRRIVGRLLTAAGRQHRTGAGRPTEGQWLRQLAHARVLEYIIDLCLRWIHFAKNTSLDVVFSVETSSLTKRRGKSSRWALMLHEIK